MRASLSGSLSLYSQHVRSSNFGVSRPVWAKAAIMKASLSIALFACLAPSHAALLETRDLVAPSKDLNNSWVYQGCYLYV